MTLQLLEDARETSLSRIKWLILARLLIAILCLALFSVLGLTVDDPLVAYRNVYCVLIAWCGLSGVYIFLLAPMRERLGFFLLLQFFSDIVIISALVFLTGGVHSNFINLYFLAIVAPSLLMSRKLSGFFASLTTMTIALVVTLYLTRTWTDFLDPGYSLIEVPDLRAELIRLLLTVIAFFSVAYFSGLLADRLDHARLVNEEILQNMSEGVAVFDDADRLLFINREFREIFGLGSSVSEGDPVEEVFRHKQDETLRDILYAKTSARFELPGVQLEDYDRASLEIRTSLLESAGNLRGMIVLAIDLSLRDRAVEAERRAERFSAVSQMAAGLAHEIRNPLASVRGSIQEISRDFEEGHPNRILSDIVLRESDRLDSIITNFLQYARQRPMHLLPADLKELLEEVVTLLQSRPDAVNMEIELQVAESLPPLICDASLLKDVFLSLGVNAVSACNGNGRLVITCPDASSAPPGTVALRQGHEEALTVSFADNGPGLPAGKEGEIFEPFFTTKPKGSGLGLAIAQRVIESHDGHLWCVSEPGKGASFFCWLPLSGPCRGGTVNRS